MARKRQTILWKGHTQHTPARHFLCLSSSVPYLYVYLCYISSVERYFWRREAANVVRCPLPLRYTYFSLLHPSPRGSLRTARQQPPNHSILAHSATYFLLPFPSRFALLIMSAHTNTQRSKPLTLTLTHLRLVPPLLWVHLCELLNLLQTTPSVRLQLWPSHFFLSVGLVDNSSLLMSRSVTDPRNFAFSGSHICHNHHLWLLEITSCLISSLLKFFLCLDQNTQKLFPDPSITIHLFLP